MPLSGLASVAARLAGKGARATKVKHPPTVHTPEFKKWFKNSEIIDEVGLPLPAYHATNFPFTGFKTFAPEAGGQEGLAFFSLNPEWASKWLASTHIPKSLKGPSKKAALVEKEVLEDTVKGKKITPQKWKQLSKVSHLLPDTESRIIPAYLSVQKLFNPEIHAHLALPTKSTIKRKLSEVLDATYRYRNEVSGGGHTKKYFTDTLRNSFNKGFFKGNYSKNNHWTPEDIEELARNYTGWDVDHLRYALGGNLEVDPYMFIQRYKALKEGHYQALEEEDILRRIKNQGFDGIKMRERMGGVEGINIAVWNPRKIKSVFNEGTWNSRSKNIGKEVGGMIERNPYPYEARAI